jgi:hypothetical protein
MKMTYFKLLNYSRLCFIANTHALSKLLFLKVSIKISLNFILFFLFAILNLNSFYAQVGIGTAIPDASSALDISSNSKGLLMPRLSTAQRNAISLPATGLMIFNTTLNDGELNIGTPSGPIWVGIKGHLEPTIQSVSLGTSTTTTSTVSE